MAINYSRTGEPVSSLQQHNWDGFIFDAKYCPKCGRSSLLFDRCPGCGSNLVSGRSTSVKRYTGFFLRGLLLIVLMQAAVLFLMDFLPDTLKLTAAVLCIVLHAVFLVILIRNLIRNRTGMELISLTDVLRERKLPSRSTQHVLHWNYLNTVHDAYHLDLATLEASTDALKAGDILTRDLLLGQAVWLSTVCDCPRLALVRLKLLGKATIPDGMDTDLNGIMNQLSSLPSDILEKTILQPQSIMTLAACLRFDPIGPGQENLQLCLSLLMRFLADPYSTDSVSPRDRSRIIQTLAYYGPEAYQDSLLAELIGLGIGEALIRFNEDFRAIPEFAQ